MSDESKSKQIEKWLLLFADRVQEHSAYLTELDAAIGDADHGENLLHATNILRQKLVGRESALAQRTPEELLRLIGITLLNHIGGAAGPLYGSLFFHAANAAKQSNHSAALQLADVTAWFSNGLTGIQTRGMVTGGEKTMADTLLPVVQSLQQSVQTNGDIQSALAQARDAAHAGMSQTTALRATKGRASYHGARTIGHQDPGATSMYLLIETAAEVFGALERSQRAINY